MDNPEPRCPCLLLDSSTSMAGQRIDELNAGLNTFASQLTSDGLAAKRVEVAVISFGPVRLQTDFTTAENFTPPSYEPTATHQWAKPSALVSISLRSVNNLGLKRS